MKVGIGEMDITPDFPCPLAGFGQARTANHTGIHDRLSARCAVFASGGELLALCSVEVIGMKSDLVAQIRSAVEAICGLPAERLLMPCTHTHGAPVLSGDYVPFLIDRVAEAVKRAMADLRPRNVLTGRGQHTTWAGFNRRHLERGFLPVDRDVPFLKITESDGSCRAVLFHYACHPSILGPQNLEITGDWPFYARQRLEEHFGRHTTAIYLKGTEGNINTGYSAGISSMGIPIPTRTYETARQTGWTVADSVIQADPKCNLMDESGIRFTRETLPLLQRDPEQMNWARDELSYREQEIARLEAGGRSAHEILQARVERAYAFFNLQTLQQIAASGGREIEAELTVFRLGPAAFMTFPGEFFVESGLAFKAGSNSPCPFPLGITNDYMGYFPTAEEFPEGGYEVACARFVPETAQTWTRRGLELLHSLA
jgi:neutral ceramidase